jgi:hypothetical protein
MIQYPGMHMSKREFVPMEVDILLKFMRFVNSPTPENGNGEAAIGFPVSVIWKG